MQKNDTDDDNPPPDVLVSHSGEQKLSVVDHVRGRFAEKHPQLKVFVDEWNLRPGARAMDLIWGACNRARVGKCARRHRPEWGPPASPPRP